MILSRRSCITSTLRDSIMVRGDIRRVYTMDFLALILNIHFRSLKPKPISSKQNCSQHTNKYKKITLKIGEACKLLGYVGQNTSLPRIAYLTLQECKHSQRLARRLDCSIIRASSCQGGCGEISILTSHIPLLKSCAYLASYFFLGLSYPLTLVST